jgi:AhpD family alkylhydroperoxidase
VPLGVARVALLASLLDASARLIWISLSPNRRLHPRGAPYIGHTATHRDAIAMGKDYKAITADIAANMSRLRSDIPDTMKGFTAMALAAGADGALTKKTKELIALGIAIAVHCDGCIGFHVKALVRLGATKQEIEEALGMAIYMGGGPSVMYAADALAAYDQFSAA